jgi:predicted RNase H-like nuclease
MLSTIKEWCFLRSASRVAMQRWGKHISEAVNQHASIEVAVFSVEAAPRLYNEDLRQLREYT